MAIRERDIELAWVSVLLYVAERIQDGREETGWREVFGVTLAPYAQGDGSTRYDVVLEAKNALRDQSGAPVTARMALTVGVLEDHVRGDRSALHSALDGLYDALTVNIRRAKRAAS